MAVFLDFVDSDGEVKDEKWRTCWWNSNNA